MFWLETQTVVSPQFDFTLNSTEIKNVNMCIDEQVKIHIIKYIHIYIMLDCQRAEQE